MKKILYAILIVYILFFVATIGGFFYLNLKLKVGESVSVSRNSGRGGNMIAIGEVVRLSNKVKGNALFVGENVGVNDLVTGNVVSMGENVNLDSHVEKSFIGLGEHVQIKGDALVDNNLVVAGELVEIDGLVSQNAYIVSEKVVIQGEIKGKTYIDAEEINFKEGAKFNDIRMFASKFNTEEGVSADKVEYVITDKGGDIEKVISEETEELEIVNGHKPGFEFSFEGEKEKKRNWLKGSDLFLSIIAVIIFALVFKEKPLLIAKYIRSRPVKTMLVGLLSIILWFVVSLIFFITLIGIPISLVLFILGGLALSISSAYSALFITKYLMNKYQDRIKNDSRWLTVGLCVLSVIMIHALCIIPILGCFVSFLLMLMSIGGISLYFVDRKTTLKVEGALQAESQKMD